MQHISHTSSMTNYFSVSVQKSIISGGYDNVLTNQRINDNSSIIINVPSQFDALYFFLNSGETDNAQVTIDNLMLTIGSTSTTYEPYTSQQTTLSLGSLELAKIGNYQDKLFHAVEGDSIYDDLDSITKTSLTNGKWYKQENIGKTQPQLGSMVTSYTNLDYARVYKPTDCISYDNYLNYSTLQNFAISINSSNYDSSNNINKMLITPTKLYYYLGATKGTTKTQMETALGNNSYIYYILATPTYTEVTDTTLIENLNTFEQIKSKQGVTNIFQENYDLPFYLDIVALKNLE